MQVQKLCHLLYLLFSFIIFGCCFAILVQFMSFLSFGTLGLENEEGDNSASEGVTDFSKLIPSLGVNVCLLLTFIVQHNFLTSDVIRKVLPRRDISDSLGRLTYTLLSCLVLKTLVAFWNVTTDALLWSLPLHFSVPYLVFVSLHLILWAVTFGGVVVADICELMGLEQVYLYCLGLRSNSKPRSVELKRLYSHQRHGSFTGFYIILWLQPVMTLDRFLLALVLTLYMMVAWNPTLDDLRYQEQQLHLKTNEIEYRQQRTRRYFYSQNYLTRG